MCLFGNEEPTNDSESFVGEKGLFSDKELNRYILLMGFRF